TRSAAAAVPGRCWFALARPVRAAAWLRRFRERRATPALGRLPRVAALQQVSAEHHLPGDGARADGAAPRRCAVAARAAGTHAPLEPAAGPRPGAAVLLSAAPVADPPARQARPVRPVRAQRRGALELARRVGRRAARLAAVRRLPLVQAALAPCVDP